MTYIHAPVNVILPRSNGVTVEFGNPERVVPIPSGAQGLPGEPGFSPIVSVEPITGGNRVTITDEQGDNTFDVMNGTQGEQGKPGEGVPTGGVTGQVLKKRSNTDYDTYWANESGTVLSVNGMTGAVVLDADDVGALPDDTFIPTKTSDLTNDSGFITDAGVTSFNGQTGAVTYAAPVTSVNNKTGAVTLDAEDVGAVPTEWTLLGTSSSSSQTVTYPAEAKEILIKAMPGTSGVAYYNTVPVMAIQDVTVIMVSGYYYGSGDAGLANLNHNATARTLAFRNLRYSSATSGTFTFWYR